MNWYLVKIAYGSRKMNETFAAEGTAEMAALEQIGFVENLGYHEEEPPPQEVPATYELEPEPTEEVKKRGRRGKQAEAGQDEGARAQSQAGVESRVEGDAADGGVGEG